MDQCFLVATEKKNFFPKSSLVLVLFGMTLKNADAQLMPRKTVLLQAEVYDSSVLALALLLVRLWQMLFTLSTECEEVESIPEKQISQAVPVHRGTHTPHLLTQ